MCSTRHIKARCCIVCLHWTVPKCKQFSYSKQMKCSKQSKRENKIEKTCNQHEHHEHHGRGGCSLGHGQGKPKGGDCVLPHKVIPHNYQQLSRQQRVYAEYSQNIQIKMDTPAQQQKWENFAYKDTITLCCQPITVTLGLRWCNENWIRTFIFKELRY